jgi:hypothetical protein
LLKFFSSTTKTKADSNDKFLNARAVGEGSFRLKIVNRVL